jgi:uncharacterized OsmC-like protein
MGQELRLLKVKCKNEPGKSKIKDLEFEGFPQSVRMGVHGGFSEFFGIKAEEPLPSTLDYVVAAVAGCLSGTLSGALAKRGVPITSENLTAEAEGQLEVVEGKLLLTNINVSYRLRVPKEKRAEAERALAHHDSACPVSASVRRGIMIHWTSQIEEE